MAEINGILEPEEGGIIKMTTLPLIRTFGGTGTGDGQFNGPFGQPGCIKYYGGNIYVADSGNHRIQVIGLDGTYKTQWPVYYPGSSTPVTPVGIDVYQDKVYVLTNTGGQGGLDYHIYDLSGNEITYFQTGEGVGVTVVAADTIFTLTSGDVLKEFDLSGNFLTGQRFTMDCNTHSAFSMSYYNGVMYVGASWVTCYVKTVSIADGTTIGDIISSGLSGHPVINVSAIGILVVDWAAVDVRLYNFDGSLNSNATFDPTGAFGVTYGGGLIFVGGSDTIVVYQAPALPPIISDVNVGGSWKSAVADKINVGGLWKDISAMKVNVAGEWKDLSPFSATGGDLTQANGYKIHTFTGNGTFTPKRDLTVDILVVGGGGSAGAGDGGAGGGGAGGLIYRPGLALTAQGYAVVVGAGGPQQNTVYSPGAKGNNGSDSTFGSLLTAKGGGGGSGGADAGQAGKDGGSGGGGGYNLGAKGVGNQTAQSGDSGTYGFGTDGGAGAGQGTGAPSAGGGGAGLAGSSPTDTTHGGNGGNGKQYDISGTLIYYAGGGAGGVNGGCTAGSGGLGGGGNGVSTSGGALGTPGTDRLGGGGGGGGYTSPGAKGGSGIVIIRYL